MIKALFWVSYVKLCVIVLKVGESCFTLLWASSKYRKKPCFESLSRVMWIVGCQMVGAQIYLHLDLPDSIVFECYMFICLE